MPYYDLLRRNHYALSGYRVSEKQVSDHYDYSDLNFCLCLRINGSPSLSVFFFFPYNRKGETSANDKGRQLPSYQLTKRRRVPLLMQENHGQNPSELEVITSVDFAETHPITSIESICTSKQPHPGSRAKWRDFIWPWFKDTIWICMLIFAVLIKSSYRKKREKNSTDFT